MRHSTIAGIVDSVFTRPIDSRCRPIALSRNPAVAKHLQVEAHAELHRLTPRAIRTIAELLTNKSGYIRPEAAKEALNRNGIGTAKDQSNTPSLFTLRLRDIPK
jgi:hypothetical protein